MHFNICGQLTSILHGADVRLCVYFQISIYCIYTELFAEVLLYQPQII